MNPRVLLRYALIGAGALLLTAAPWRQAAPQAGRAPRGRVLHEPPPQGTLPGRTDRVVRADNGPDGALPDDALPDAIETAAGRIDRPSLTPERSAGAEPAAVYQARVPGLSGPPDRVRPDRRTGGEGELNYKVVFNPSVTPFKRDRVFDRVAADGALEPSGQGRRPLLPQGDATATGRELFWGHVTLELVPGHETPLPSVAPDSRLLRYLATPPVPLQLHTDRAGNHSVRAQPLGSAEAGVRTVTLRFLVDAPSDYFSGPLAAGPSTDDPWRPTLPADLQRRMKALWPALDVHPTRHDRKHNVEALTRWFRDFEAGALPDTGGHMISDLVVARRGVCRHRSLGFVVMAHSLGIPAQYVMNDAHAFVEAWVVTPAGRGGWQRIDLGGSAERLNLHSAQDKHLHRPLYADALPRPASYAQAAASAASSAGLGAASWAGARSVGGTEQMIGAGRAPAQTSPAAAEASGRAPATGGERSGPTGKPDARAWMRQRALAVAALRAPPPADQRQSPPPEPGELRQRTTVSLREHEGLAYVGELLQVRGQVLAEEGPPGAPLPLEVWLVDVHKPTTGALIGSAVSKPDGGFEARVQVPLDAQLGVYDLVVRFPGDTRRAPSFSLSR